MNRPSLNSNLKIPPLIRRAVLYWLSFLLPFFILVLTLIALHIAPFGSHNLGISDGHTYIIGDVGLSYFLKEGGSFLGGLGGNSWAGWAWGGFNLPRFLVAWFATPESMPALFSWTCVLNLSLCGLTMYALLAHVCGHRVSNLIFSTSYALMGFNVAFCYHTLFFVGPHMLPLMVLGLLLLMKGRSPALYVLSLAVCIFCNFYFGFMLCVASVVIFLGYQICQGAWSWKQFRVYTAASLSAGLMPALMWLPALKAYSNGGRLDQTQTSDFRFSENMPFLQIFSKLFSGANSTAQQQNGLPFVFCGILTVALVILYFMNRRVPAVRRRVAAVVLSFYLLSFYITAFTLLMHGGTVTNWFNYRYSYVFSFLLICVAAEELRHLKELTLEETKKCGAVLLLATLLVFSTQYEYVSGGMVLVDFALLLVMWLGFWLYKTKPEQAPLRVLSLLLLLVVSLNLYLNAVATIYKMQDWEMDTASYAEHVLYTGGTVQAVRMRDDSFFRMEKDVSFTGSVGADGALYHYSGVSAAGPTMRFYIHRQMNRLGLNWFDMRHWYEAGIPAATDALLGIKYILSGRDLTAEKDYERLIKNGEDTVYLSHCYLPVGFLANDACQDVELGNNAFDNLNQVWKTMTGGKRDIFTPVEDITFTLHNVRTEQSITSEELRTSISNAASEHSGSAASDPGPDESTAYIEYTFTAQQDGPVYRFDSSVPESKNGKMLPSMVCCGVYKKGDTVTGVCKTNVSTLPAETFRSYCSTLAFAAADNAVLEDYAAQLNARDCTFDINGRKVTGTFTAGKGQRLLFTTTWDEGFTCRIDDQEVPIDKTWDLFLSVEVPEGAHSYELEFFPAWMDIGIGISCAALLGFVVLMLVWGRGKRTKTVKK